MSACRICGGPDLTAFEAREMFLGLRQPFTYQACAACGTWQLADVPPDLAGMYPRPYFDFSPPRVPDAVVAWLRDFVGGPVGSVLDVGCSTGALPAQLARWGIQAVGVDPYAPVTPAEARAQGWTFVRALEEAPGPFDVVVASHVLEHAPDLRGLLRALAAQVAPGGGLVVMMPFVETLARRYGATWIGLDPGRHVSVLTRATFVAIAQELGLEVARTQNQTLPLNLAVSEAWRADVSFAELAADPGVAGFVSQFEAEAAALRAADAGDAWAYALRRSAA